MRFQCQKLAELVTEHHLLEQLRGERELAREAFPQEWRPAPQSEYSYACYIILRRGGRGMTADQWTAGRNKSGLTQAVAARSLNVSQPYLSQLETGLRTASAQLARKAARLYKLPPTALPLPESFAPRPGRPDYLQNQLASLGYPGFEHVRARQTSNPAEVVLSAVVQRDLDTRLVEALPWVLKSYTDLNWEWLRDWAKLQNAQNRLGYLVHLARETAGALVAARQCG